MAPIARSVKPPLSCANGLRSLAPKPNGRSNHDGWDDVHLRPTGLARELRSPQRHRDEAQDSRSNEAGGRLRPKPQT